MKHYLFLVLFVLVSFSQIGCSENKLDDNDLEILLQLNNAHEINNSKISDTADIKIQFLKVIEYSICPADVNCVWAGRAIIELKINNDSIVKIALLDNEIPNKITFQNYEIELLDVIPINENEYTIKLKITS